MEQPLRRQWVEAHACITNSEPPWPAARLQHRAVRCSEATAKREKLAFGENRVDLSCGSSVLNKTRTVMRNSCSRQVRVGQKGKHPSMIRDGCRVPPPILDGFDHGQTGARPDGACRAMHPAADKPVGDSAAGAEETGSGARRPPASIANRAANRCPPCGVAIRICQPFWPLSISRIRAGRHKRGATCYRRVAQPRIEPRAIQVPANGRLDPGGNRSQPELAAPISSGCHTKAGSLVRESRRTTPYPSATAARPLARPHRSAAPGVRAGPPASPGASPPSSMPPPSRPGRPPRSKRRRRSIAPAPQAVREAAYLIDPERSSSSAARGSSVAASARTCGCKSSTSNTGGNGPLVGPRRDSTTPIRSKWAIMLLI